MINSLFIFGAMTFLKQKVEAIHKKRSTSKKTNKQILPRPILINWKVGSYYYSRHLSRHTKINKQKKWHCVPNASVHLNTLNLNLLEFSRRKRNWGETGRVWIHFVFLNCTWAFSLCSWLLLSWCECQLTDTSFLLLLHCFVLVALFL